jgi:cysteine desulfurase/selenocysteine lyase
MFSLPTNLRSDFPQLKEGNYHYFDTAATSLTPESVLRAMSDYYVHDRANVHRGLFPEAIRATEHYEEARKKVATFLNAAPEEIIFTSGATESSNMLVRMLEESPKFWTPNITNIVTTVMEHHGALIPLQQLAKRRTFSLEYIPLAKEGGAVGLDYEAAEKLITDNTGLVSVMLASNVTGVINDVARIAQIAHSHHTIMVVDATAAAGHIPLDVEKLDCDALYFSGHKMFAPTGVGVLWVKKTLLEKLEPSIFGGHMITRVDKDGAEWAPSPTRFEAGTKDIAGVIGLGAAIDYCETIGVANMHTHVSALVTYAITALEAIHGVRIIAERDSLRNVGMVSFVCDFAHPHDVAEILAREHIAVRPGHHCAMPYHTALGVDATTRASFHAYNTKEDIDALVAGVEKARKIFA